MADEKAYLRSFVDETYLWYKEVPSNLVAANYTTPQAYFDVLKTTAKTASGVLVDQFHWSQTTASYDAANAGTPVDYGIQWAAQASTSGLNIIVADVAPGSPAALAGVVKRGDQLTSIDGVDSVYFNTVPGKAALNLGLFPEGVATHAFGFNGKPAINLTTASYITLSVPAVQTITTGAETVGYFIFDTHIAKSRAELIAAINQLKDAKVSDLIIDMRYNGGGALYIASELAYMIAGPGPTNGKTFEQLIFNDKLTSSNTVYPFYNAFISGNATLPLPSLGLNHVTILTTRDTASASESVINSLRGVDVTVDLIGSTTRGKPYGFVPQDNCGHTYFSIQFKGVNAKGYGDYVDGFAPTCVAPDDFSHARGETAETMLATALSYRQTKPNCPDVAVVAQPFLSASGQGFKLLRPASQEMRILSTKPHL
jgi:C-terminal processing protease CtpA/Prc